MLSSGQGGDVRFPFESKQCSRQKDLYSQGDFLRPSQTNSSAVKRLIFMRVLVAFVTFFPGPLEL